MPRRQRDGTVPVEVLQTPLGPARAYRCRAADPWATLILGHGAGRDSGTSDLLDLARALPPRGIEVVRFDQPWVVAGRRVAGPPPTLDRALLAAVPALDVAGRLLLGGRSAGARVACRTAGRLRAVGVLALAFPLHPPGRPDRSRAPELVDTGAPVLVLQGERDAFGRPDDVRAAAADVPSIEVVEVAGADHALRAGLSEPLLELVADWVRGVARA